MFHQILTGECLAIKNMACEYSGLVHGQLRWGAQWQWLDIEPGQVFTMQVDTDADTLKFWLDGKPHGPGHTSGVTGPLRWAINVSFTRASVEIVPTPELQP